MIFLFLEPKLKNTGLDCWPPCSGQQGPCSWCGTEGMCCTMKTGWSDTSNGCDGTFGGETKHECYLRPGTFLTKLGLPVSIVPKIIAKIIL